MRSTTTTALRALSKSGVLAWVERLLRSTFGQRAQRFGEEAWERVAARWPMLADLLESTPLAARRANPVIVHPHTRSPAQQGPVASPAEVVVNAGAADTLLAQLANAANWKARADAAQALADVDDPGVTDALARALRDTCAEVAVAAVDALGRRRDARAIEALRSLLESADSFLSPLTRTAAVLNLARLLPQARFAPVLEAVHDLQAEVSIAAIAAVAQYAPELAAGTLFSIVDDKTGFHLPMVRLAATHALERARTLSPARARELLQSEGDAAVRAALERIAAGAE
jgi:hypothetical protein